jgi:hypothetical protein
LDSTEEVRVNATLQSTHYLQGLRRHYNKSTQHHSFQVGDRASSYLEKWQMTQTTQSMGRPLHYVKGQWARNVWVDDTRRNTSQKYMAYKPTPKILRLKD